MATVARDQDVVVKKESDGALVDFPMLATALRKEDHAE
jgi:hypothetical protein